LALTLALAACTSNGTGASTFSTSVTASTQLGMLQSAQQQQLCADLKAFTSSSSVYADALDAGCRIAGIVVAGLSNAQTDGDLQAACTQAYNACKDDAGKSSSLGTETAAACEALTSSCTATVAQLTTCLNDMFGALHMALASVPSCGSITRASLADGGGLKLDFDVPESCKALADACPELKK
jgi:hypothetical protein